MFNFSGSEIVFLLLLALIVLGPEKLPEAVRKFGKTYGEFKKMTTGFQSELKSALDEPMREMRETADAFKKAASFDFDADADADADAELQPSRAETKADADARSRSRRRRRRPPATASPADVSAAPPTARRSAADRRRHREPRRRRRRSADAGTGSDVLDRSESCATAPVAAAQLRRRVPPWRQAGTTRSPPTGEPAVPTIRATDAQPADGDQGAASA